MRIDPFGLERWFAEYEHEADIMLAESGIRSLDASRFDLDPGRLDYVIPTNGDPDFRDSVGKRYGRSADEVLFTCGTQEANFLTFLSLLGDAEGLEVDSSTDSTVGSGSHAVVVTPTYQALHAVPEAFGDVTRVELEPPEWELDPDTIADAARDDTAVIVVNNPNNPTGRYHDEAAMRAVYDVAVDHDAYLLGRGVPPARRGAAAAGREFEARNFDDESHQSVRARRAPIRLDRRPRGGRRARGGGGRTTPPSRRACSASTSRSRPSVGARAAHLRGEPRAGGNEPRYRRRLARSPRPRLVRPGRRQRVRHGARWVRRRRGVLPGRRRDGERRARARRAVRLPGPLPDRVRAPTAELEEGLQRVSRVIEGESASEVDAEGGA